MVGREREELEEFERQGATDWEGSDDELAAETEAFDGGGRFEGEIGKGWIGGGAAAGWVVVLLFLVIVVVDLLLSIFHFFFLLLICRWFMILVLAFFFFLFTTLGSKQNKPPLSLYKSNYFIFIYLFIYFKK